MTPSVTGSADVGIGTRRFRDPALVGEFSAIPLPIDVAEFHTYGVDWRPGSTDITVDGEVVRHVDEAPDYPMQLFIGVFDFPAKASDDQKVPVPEMVIAHVLGHPLDLNRSRTTSVHHSAISWRTERAIAGNRKNCDRPWGRGGVADADLGEPGAGDLELAHHLDADHPRRRCQLDTIDELSLDQAEVAVGVTDAEVEQQAHGVVVGPADQLAVPRVAPAELVALHEVDPRRRPHRCNESAPTPGTARRRRCRRPRCGWPQ